MDTAPELEPIHVDVRRAPHHYIIETSVGGSGWYEHYRFPLQIGESPETTRRHAEECARIMVHALRFAGRTVRATSGGYAL